MNNREIVNGHFVPDSTPTIHGNSVEDYWSNLKAGRGYSAKGSIYDKGKKETRKLYNYANQRF